MTSLILASLIHFNQAPAPQIHMNLDQQQVFAGCLVTGKVVIEFADGMHGYQNPPSKDYQIPIEVKSSSEKVKLVSVNYPKGHASKIGGELEPSMSYSGTTVIPFIARVQPGTDHSKFNLTVSYQQCNEISCFPPGEITTSQDLKILSKPDSFSITKRLGADIFALAQRGKK